MKELTQSELHALLDYDPETGLLKWRVNRRGRFARIGVIAGSMRSDGYLVVCVDCKQFLVHRLVWLYMTGKLPKHQVDHINGIKSDNRFSNLRLASSKQNRENQKLRTNNSSGFRGVTYYRRDDKWQARIGHNGIQYHIGLFDTKEDAAQAAKEARDRLFTHHKTPYSA